MAWHELFVSCEDVQQNSVFKSQLELIMVEQWSPIRESAMMTKLDSNIHVWVKRAYLVIRTVNIYRQKLLLMCDIRSLFHKNFLVSSKKNHTLNDKILQQTLITEGIYVWFLRIISFYALQVLYFIFCDKAKPMTHRLCKLMNKV